MLQNSLASGEMMDMLDIIHATTSCRTMARFQELAKGLQNLLGCSKTTFCWKSLEQDTLLTPPHLLNVSFPEQFLKLLSERRLWRQNPISIRGMQQEGLQSWQDTFNLMSPPKQLLDIKYSFGLYSGYTFSVASQRPRGVTMVSTGGYDSPKIEIERLKFILCRLMPHFHLALSEVLEHGRDKNLPALTGREVEVLSWLKEGKTSWEISVILKISERTINFHVTNVKKKLNVNNRMGAVAQAMHLGLVN